MGDYHDYYSGQREAPYLTIFCGGNHEASNHMFELYHGGWIAHNIYYLGAANVVRFGPLRIAGMSGIWKGYDYRKPHYERVPYRPEDLHSVFHVRELDVRKLLQVRTQVDIGLSHDWPREIEMFGDHKKLFRKKRGFQEDSLHGKLGNPAAREVLDRLRPAYWFSAHLHVEFAATLAHDNVATKKVDVDPNVPAAWGVELADPVVPVDEPIAPANVDKPNENATLTASGEAVSNKIIAAYGSEADRLAAWGSFQSVDMKTREKQFSDMIHQMNDPRPATEVQVTWKKASSGKSDVTQDSLVYSSKRVKNNDEIDLGSDDDSAHECTADEDQVTRDPWETTTDGANDGNPLNPPVDKDTNMSLVDQAVAENLRTKLPAAFARPPPMAAKGPKTIPRAIHNKLTKFLALDKPSNHDPYIKLLNIAPISDQASTSLRTPYRLQYDKEWLAITRVFADGLVLGDQTSKVPSDLGEDAYLPLIQEQEAWVEENIVSKGLMNIPFNFTRSAPRFHPESDIQHPTMPMEFPNLQTVEFCELLQIENKFYLNEEQRYANYQSIPSTQMANGDGSEERRRPRRGGHGHRGRGRRGGRGIGRGSS